MDGMGATGEPAAPVPVRTPTGLTSDEARKRLRQFGANEVATERRRPWLGLLFKFWAPIPWMLEATALLQLVLGKWLEAAIVCAILVLNALLGFVQEGRAQAAVGLLRTRLAVRARVLRDGAWGMVEAAGLVPGDSVHVRMGDLIPADLRLTDGQLLLDQSALTGESVAVELEPPGPAYSGSR